MPHALSRILITWVKKKNESFANVIKGYVGVIESGTIKLEIQYTQRMYCPTLGLRVWVIYTGPMGYVWFE